jgi:hypothetical protein
MLQNLTFFDGSGGHGTGNNKICELFNLALVNSNNQTTDTVQKFIGSKYSIL